MRILIISDLHGNAEALSVLPQDYDQLWVLGDLVNYGPNPSEVIEFVQSHASLVISGNHDYAIGFNTDPRCSGPYVSMAAEMGQFTQSVLNEEEKSYLRSLPANTSIQIERASFYLCHATPSDPLFAYCPPDSPKWPEEVHSISADWLLVGHTHLQFQRRIEETNIVNPGSVGQAKMNSPAACFAVWEDGRINLYSRPYDHEKTIGKIKQLHLSKEVEEDLATVLRQGNLPPQRMGS